MTEHGPGNRYEVPLPADLWEMVVAYLDDLRERRARAMPAGWGNGHRRIPHC